VALISVPRGVGDVEKVSLPAKAAESARVLVAVEGTLFVLNKCKVFCDVHILRACMQTYIHPYIHACTHACMYMYTHTRTHETILDRPT
jgi:hypothetical protein